MNTVVAHAPSNLPANPAAASSRWPVARSQTVMYSPEDAARAAAASASPAAAEDEGSTLPPPVIACMLAVLTTMLLASGGMAIRAMF